MLLCALCLASQLSIQARDDLLVSSALERHALRLIVEAQSKPELYAHASSARMQDGVLDGRSVERWALDKDVSLSVSEPSEPRCVLSITNVRVSRRSVRTTIDECHWDGCVLSVEDEGVEVQHVAHL